MTGEIDPRLVGAFFAAGIFDILLPIAVVLFIRRRLGPSWVVFAIGAMAFVASQILTRLPLVIVAQVQLKQTLQSSMTAQLVWVGVLAVTAGLFEETARYLCFRYALKEESNWTNAVALGAGHGGIESALLVGASVLATAFGVIMVGRVDPATLPAATPESIEGMLKAKQAYLALRWWEPLLGGWERVVSIGVHISLSVMVLQRFVRGQMLWFWLAVAYHALSNAVAIAALKAWGAVAAEGILTLFLIASLAIIFRLRPREPTPAPAPG